MSTTNNDYIVFAEHLSKGEQVAVTLGAMFSAVLSLGGSGGIIWMICADWQRNIKSPKYRLLLALSVADIINSLVFLFWPFPFPRDTPGVFMAYGNDFTCNLAAWFMQLGCMGAFYNAGLSHYYLMVLYYGWSDEKVAKLHEPWIHAVSWLFPIGTSTAALLQDLYAPSALGCWITPQPRLCHVRDELECIKGDNAVWFGWLYQGAPLFSLLIYIAYAMFFVYKKVQEVTKKAERWTMTLSASQYSVASSVVSRSAAPESAASDDTGTEDKQMRRFSLNSKRKDATQKANKTKEVATQAILYVGAYLTTHMWAFVVYHLDLYANQVPGVLMIIQNISWPLQGFFNLFIFIRPQVQSTRRQHEDLSYWQAVYVVLLGNDKKRQRAIDRALRSSTEFRPNDGSKPYLSNDSGAHTHIGNSHAAGHRGDSVADGVIYSVAEEEEDHVNGNVTSGNDTVEPQPEAQEDNKPKNHFDSEFKDAESCEPEDKADDTEESPDAEDRVNDTEESPEMGLSSQGKVRANLRTYFDEVCDEDQE